MNSIQQVILKLMEQISNHYNIKVDAHYEEWRGVIIVPFEKSLIPQNVIASISYNQLKTMVFTGANIKFK